MENSLPCTKRHSPAPCVNMNKVLVLTPKPCQLALQCCPQSSISVTKAA